MRVISLLHVHWYPLKRNDSVALINKNDNDDDDDKTLEYVQVLFSLLLESPVVSPLYEIIPKWRWRDPFVDKETIAVIVIHVIPDWPTILDQ